MERNALVVEQTSRRARAVNNAAREMATLIADCADRASIVAALRTWPDFPRAPISFVDIFSLWQQPALVEAAIASMAAALHARWPDATTLAGLDSRGFLFGVLLAARLQLRFAPVRKAGKLPGPTTSKSYSLEYGENTLELQSSSLSRDDRVVLVDDLLATGGTLAAAATLVRGSAATLLGGVVFIELEALSGAAAVGVPLLTLIKS